MPLNEGNTECLKCDKFDFANGCICTYAKEWKNKLPKCGRDIILSQKELINENSQNITHKFVY